MEPLLGVRYAEEPPVDFLVHAVKASGDSTFRVRMLDAGIENLRRLAMASLAGGTATFWADVTNDEHLAGLAFLISTLEGREAVAQLHLFASAWLTEWQRQRVEPTFGQSHLLRALAHLQQGSALAGFWKDLWTLGPSSLRGLAFFGWSRADADAALAHLGELIDLAGELDLPSILWSLLEPGGPDSARLAKAARVLRPGQQEALREALARAGGDNQLLAEYEFFAMPGDTPAASKFLFPSEVPANPARARQAPRWAFAEAA